MKLLTWISLFTLASLSCGVASTLPAYENTTHTQEVGTFVNPTAENTSIVRVDEALNIRDGAGGNETGNYLHNGDVVEIYQAEWSNDTLWCAITPERTRWVACRYLKGK